MRTRETDFEPFVNLSELTEIELLILRRMREFTIGEHRSVFHGSGFDLVGLRDWQAGDRLSMIDWPQSTLTNFSPMIVRDFEQRSTATVIAVADASLSTRCGIDGFDVETGKSRVMSRGAMTALSRRTRAWQDDVAKTAKNYDLDVLRIGVDETETAIALGEFIAERRLRKV